eukprot:6212929-Pleurochrysis_carterae.AAC.5
MILVTAKPKPQKWVPQRISEAHILERGVTTIPYHTNSDTARPKICRWRAVTARSRRDANQPAVSSPRAALLPAGGITARRLSPY